jgi:xylulokinase
MATHLLGLDIGTTGVKGVLIDERGVSVAIAAVEYPLLTPKPNWAEQNPEDWWNATVLVIQRILSDSRAAPSSIKGIGLSGQMHSLVLLDKGHSVLRPAILWCDTRTEQECKWINGTIGRERMRDLVANPALEGFTLPKILWVRNNEPEIYKRIRTVLLPKDYIRFRLTGEVMMDVSDAAGTALFDVAHRRWAVSLLNQLAIASEWCPPVRESIDVCGKVMPKIARITGLEAGTPVVGGGADNTCGAVGTGVVKEGRVLASVGTSGVVFAHTDSMKVEPKMRVHTFCHSVPGAWYVMGVMLMAGGALRWYRDTFGQQEREEAKMRLGDAYDLMTEAASTIPRGSDGLFFLPYLAGERTPHQSAMARGAFIGATIRHTKAHFSRSVLEGITYGMRDSLEIVKSMGLEIQQIRLTGGGAKSKFWRQLQADIYGHEVALVNTSEGPAFGAALLAGVGSGVYRHVLEATENIVRVTESIAPDPTRAAMYSDWYEIYRGLYPALSETYSAIHRRTAGS